MKPACEGLPVDLFFPGRGQSAAPAKAICAGCEIRTACLQVAMEIEGFAPQNHRHGVFGGMTPLERWQLTRAVEL